MASLNRSQLNLLSRVINSSATEFNFNQTWKAVGYELDIDIERWLINSRKIIINSERRGLLRNTVKALLGFDLIHGGLVGNRLETSKTFANEKLSPIKPEQNYVLIRPIGFEFTDIQPLWSLRVLVDDALKLIANYQIERLIIVENLDVFDCWQLQGLPQATGKSLLVFNGSKQQYSAIGARALCSFCGKPIWIFGDLDPAGLQIAHKLPNVQALVAPKDLNSLLSMMHSYTGSLA